MAEIYISVDIETDGPIPGPNSMLSLGAAAFTLERGMVSSFAANLETLPGAVGDPNTMKWWAGQPDAWEAARKEAESPATVMENFSDWVWYWAEFCGARPVFVGYPAGFDFTFVYWYLIKFTGESPFSFSAIDIKTYAMALLDLGYRDSTKRNMLKEWFSNRPHTHVAVEDAIEQGELFMNMLKWRQDREIMTHVEWRKENL